MQKITDRWHLMKLQLPESPSITPGQFLHIRLPFYTDPLLRRPFSIHYWDPVDGTVWILFEVVGKGTSLMAGLIAGDTLDVLGPLGNGFRIFPEDKNVVLIAGGIGMAPLFFLASSLFKKENSFDFFIGVPTAAHLPLPDYFYLLGREPVIATEDGTLGFKGMVTDCFYRALEEKKEGEKPDRIYACGPTGMLSSLVAGIKEIGIPIQVSLETTMACGVGACQGCVCRVIPPENQEEFEFRRVCKDGPIFSGELVVFDELRPGSKR